MKQKGILLPIFSLPSKHGIGDFGNEAYKFIDILSKNKIQYWEILPITATEKYPYSPQSYYALNTDYISVDKLKEMNLLENIVDDEITSKKTLLSENIQANYKEIKEKYYKKAYSNFKLTEEYYRFKDNKKIIEYAKYIEKHTGTDIDYTFFLQYILDKQWNELKEYANSKNVKIIGDMPIYPNFNSAEVENNPSCFQLKNGEMEYISGVPSDTYNREGQIWGTPVYDCNYLKDNNYTYLVERYKEFLKRFDIVRIDHFIGYDLYYKIPINKTVNEGIYEKGPSYSFFDELLKISSVENFIVEDLGLVKDSTIKLRENYGFLGSAILQEFFDKKLHCNKDNEWDKVNNIDDCNLEFENKVLYTGTHDCNTIVGWYKSLKLQDKKKLRKVLKREKCNDFKINKAIMKYCMKSKAEIVILPLQDVLGLGENARINVPGKMLKENWSWMLQGLEEVEKEVRYFGKL